MSSPVHVRPARMADLPQILALARATAEAPHWSEAAYETYVLAPETAAQRKVLFAALAGGCVQGFAAASAVADEAELESIAVAAAARRSRLGTRLLEAVQLWARQAAARSLTLEVRSANRSARAFYASHGFTEAGQRRAYYRDPVDAAVLLRRSLPGDDALEPVQEANARLFGGTEL